MLLFSRRTTIFKPLFTFILMSLTGLPWIYSKTPQVFLGESPQIALLELYTSEGCDSCPPAEKFFSSLKKRGDLFKKTFPLVFHVNYWDYLGWKDPLAQEKFTKRQRFLANSGGHRTIYTPGVYSQSSRWKKWRYKPVQHKTSQGKLKAEIKEKNVSIQYDQKNKKVDFHFAILGFDITSKIQSGERSGEKTIHDFVVLSYQKKSGKKGLSFSLDSPSLGQKRQALISWVTEVNGTTPLQVTGGYLNMKP